VLSYLFAMVGHGRHLFVCDQRRDQTSGRNHDQARARADQSMAARTPRERPADSPWFTVTETAAGARVREDTVGDALRSGDLRGYQTGPNDRWRIHVNDIDAWIKGDVAVVVPHLRRAE
jgi:excisionase family DNA binding protein